LVGHARARMGLIRSFQITSIFPEMTVLENVALAVQVRLANACWHLWRSVGDDARIIAPAHSYLQIVGLGRRASCIANTMSHGERRLLEIAIALATEPLLLLLDEPMAGLGPEESSSMLTLIEGLRRDYAVLLVEHDMDAVFTLADRISVMVYGKISWELPRILNLFPSLTPRLDQSASILSGGEQQMLAIGRALLTNPRLLILDEATEGLSPLVREKIWKVLGVIRDAGIATIIVDKNIAKLMQVADCHYILEKGRIVFCGSSDTLAKNPDLLRQYVGV
jgi:ABC-type branched-subunit amino acid transport system ATPase component